MRHPAKQPHVCPFGELLEILARPWTLQILWVLSTKGPTRFGALRRQVEGFLRGCITKRMKDISNVMGDLDVREAAPA